MSLIFESIRQYLWSLLTSNSIGRQSASLALARPLILTRLSKFVLFIDSSNSFGGDRISGFKELTCNFVFSDMLIHGDSCSDVSFGAAWGALAEYWMDTQTKKKNNFFGRNDFIVNNNFFQDSFNYQGRKKFRSRWICSISTESQRCDKK